MLALGAALLVEPAFASADEPHVVWVAGNPEGDVAGRARRWSRRVAQALAQRGANATEEAEAWALRSVRVSRVRVEALARVEELLRAAERARASLDHRRALEHLVEAARIAESALDAPGATAWYAEAQIALAVTATELGEEALAAAALTRAAMADPRRQLRAGEAPPSLTARAEEIARRIASGSRGAISIESEPDGARAWLDGRLLGVTPIRVEGPIGPHIVRVAAPGHRAWASPIDVFGATSIRVTLSPDPVLVATRELRRAATERDLQAVVDALVVLESMSASPRALWMVETSTGAMDRAIVIACRPDGCDAPRRIDVERVESVLPDDPDAPGDRGDEVALDSARAWMSEPLPEAPPPPPAYEWWTEPWPWVIAGAVVLGGTALGVGLSWPSPQVEQRTSVDGTGVFMLRAP